MKKRILQVRKITADIAVLKEALNESPEVVAAYLFGSAARDEPVVNDLDVLVLLHQGTNKDTIYFDLICRIAQALDFTEDQVDILFFDLQEAAPEILYEALNQGILLKNESPELLSDKIDELSHYLIENEFFIQQAKQLERERLEAFCEG